MTQPSGPGPQWDPQSGRWYLPEGQYPPPPPGYQPYGFPQGAPQPPSPRKRRKWPYVLGGVGALLVVIGMSGPESTPTVDTAPVAASSGGAAGAPVAPPVVEDEAPGTTRLEAVSSKGRTVSVTYSVGDAGISTSNVKSGWSKEFPEPESFTFSMFSVSTSMDGAMAGGSDTITCRVIEDGKVVKEQTAEGQYASASCSGF